MDLPSEQALRRIIGRYARLHAAHGASIGRPVLVQPTGDFFPDEFRGDAPSIVRLLRRLATYAPIADDLPVEIAFAAPEDTQNGGCGTIACCSVRDAGATSQDVEETGDGYRVWLSTNTIGHPNLLTASLARSIGALVLHEAGEETSGDGAAEAAEVAAVACGFGVLLTNGAEVWGKSCGGLRMARATALTLREMAFALALFVSLHRLKPSQARAHLEATQREALQLALSFIDSNPRLVEDLRDRPALLDPDAFAIEPVRGAFGRWLGAFSALRIRATRQRSPS
jgi:hypothetical protein